MNLIAGATGTLGGLIARGLLERGEPVRILVRPGSSYEPLERAGADVVFGDVKDPASLAPAFAGIRRAITTVNSASRGGSDTVESVDVEGNRNLIEAAAAAGLEQFLFVSALGGEVDSPIPFMRAKGEAEAQLQRSGVPCTILKPNIFMEVWIGMIVGAPVQANRPVTLVGEGRRRHSFISVDDVAAFALAAVGNPAALGRTLVIGGPEALSWVDVVRTFERVLGRSIPIERVAPGEPLPGFPDVVAQLAAGMETYDSVIDMDGLAREWEVKLTSVEDFARSMIAAH